MVDTREVLLVTLAVTQRQVAVFSSQRFRSTPLRKDPNPWSEMTINKVFLSRHLAIVLPTRSSMRAIQVLDDVAACRARPGRAGPGAVSSMSRQKRVLEAVGPVRDAGDQPSRESLSIASQETSPLARWSMSRHCSDELIVVDDVLIEGPRIGGQPEGREWP